MTRLLPWLKKLVTTRVNRRAADQDLHEELNAYMALREDELIAAGTSPGPARRLARAELSGFDAVAEGVRDTWPAAWADSVTREVRYALRSALRAPAFSVTVVLTAALGVGAVSSFMTLASGLLYREPSLREPAQLRWIARPKMGRPWDTQLSWPEIEQYSKSGVFSDIVGFYDARAGFSDRRQAARSIAVELVSQNYFTALGVAFSRGRGFLQTPSREIVLSHRLWSEHLGRDSAIVGRQVALNGIAFEVVGVLSPDYAGLLIERSPDAIIPLSEYHLVFPGWQSTFLQDPKVTWLHTVGRLGATVGDKSAAARLQAIVDANGASDPETKGTKIQLDRVRGGDEPRSMNSARIVLSFILVIPLFVLLISCGNVAALFVARGIARARESTIRSALGAGRSRLYAQMLTEIVILVGAGGAIGIALSPLLGRGIVQLAKLPSEFQSLGRADWRVSLAASVITLVAAVLVSLIAGRHLLSLRGFERSQLRGGAAPRRVAMRALVSTQIALSFVLAALTALSIRSLRQALTMELGFSPQSLVYLTVDPMGGNADPARRHRFVEAMRSRILLLPGVTSVTEASLPPFGGRMVFTAVSLADGADTAKVEVAHSQAGADFFRTFGIAMRRGSDFREYHVTAGKRVAVMNTTLAERLFGQRDPIGRLIRLGGDSLPVEVIGVSHDFAHSGARDKPGAFLAVSPAVSSSYGGITVVVRSSQPASVISVDLRRMVQEYDPDLAIERIADGTRLVSDSERRVQSLSRILSVFAAIALSLSALGLYGVLAFAIHSRRRELAVRLAVGAKPARIVREVMLEGGRLAVVGLGVGMAASTAISVFLTKELFGLGAFDLPSFAICLVLTAATIALASSVPARMGARVPPALLLREN